MLSRYDAVFPIPPSQGYGLVHGVQYREWAAAKALAGVLASDTDGNLQPKQAADLAVDSVDALIARLNEEPSRG